MDDFFPVPHCGSTNPGMRAAEAERVIRQWFEEYGSFVQKTLRSYGIWMKEDREELALDVFSTAFLALERGVTIDNPGAWLRECARRHASGFRQKQRRRALLRETEEFLHGVVNDVLSPEQIVGDREIVGIAFDSLPESLQEIILALRLEGSSYEEIARERGITIHQAKYLHDVAVEKMEEALQRADAKRTKRRLFAFPILLAHFFDALRSEVDGASPELDRRVGERLDRFLEPSTAVDTEPESVRVSFTCPAPSILITAPLSRPLAVRPELELLRRGLTIAVGLGCLLPGAPLVEPSPELRHASSTPALATVEPAPQGSGARASAPRLPANGSRALAGELLPEDTRGARRASAVVPLKAGSSSGSRRLLDRVRDALQTGDMRAALTRLAQHARIFPGMDAADRRDVRESICAAPAARTAPLCARSASNSALP